MYCQYIKFTDVLIMRTQKGLLMAIRLDELFDKTKRTFELKLIAGKGGLNHIVGWVHLLEDEIILNRFGGQELAVTTGMKSQEPDWLHEKTGLFWSDLKHRHVPKKHSTVCY